MALNKELSVAAALSHLEMIRSIRRVNLSGAIVVMSDIEAIEKYTGSLELFEEVGQVLPPSMVARFRKSLEAKV
jgi:hypothetical protein